MRFFLARSSGTLPDHDASRFVVGLGTDVESPVHNLADRLRLTTTPGTPQTRADAGLVQNPTQRKMNGALVDGTSGKAVETFDQRKVRGNTATHRPYSRPAAAL